MTNIFFEVSTSNNMTLNYKSTSTEASTSGRAKIYILNLLIETILKLQIECNKSNLVENTHI